MKTNFFAYCLLLTAFFIFSCSSGTKDKDANKSANESAVDTSMRGLTGVIEENPPVQQGEYITKYPNGVIKMRGYYQNGKRHAQWTSFFENGNIQSEGFFKDGLRDGKATVYFENGKVYYEGYYKDGKEVGKWIFYDESGKKIKEKDYGVKPNS
jgi:hypothetical protein